MNSIRVQDAVFEQAVLSYQNTVLQAQQEVEDARAAFLAAQQTLTTLGEAAHSARRTTELAIVRYKEGASDYTTVLTAEQLELQIEDALASARAASRWPWSACIARSAAAGSCAKARTCCRGDAPSK